MTYLYRYNGRTYSAGILSVLAAVNSSSIAISMLCMVIDLGKSRYWKSSITGVPFFLYALDAFNADEIWKRVKNLLIGFEIWLSFWLSYDILFNHKKQGEK